MSDAAPKDWAEAVPSILFGTFGFAFGFEAVVAMNEGHWGLFFANLVACFGCAGIAIVWGKYRSSLPNKLANKMRVVANSPMSLFALFLILWAIPMYQITSLRSDFEMYMMPRQLSQQQAKDLTAYLSSHGPYSVSVRADPADREALEYASGVFNAIHQSEWTSDFNLTNDDPKPAGEGLTIQELGSNSKPNDPKHDPAAALREAFQAAGILVTGGGSTGAGTYKLFVMVGRRPLAIGRQPPILFRVGQWFMKMATYFR
jgi:hypothetical protein